MCSWGAAAALVALGLGERRALLFVATMLAGMALFELLEWRRLARERLRAA